MDWYDRAEKQIEEDYAAGDMTDKEYREAIRDLNDEHEQARWDAAQVLTIVINPT